MLRVLDLFSGIGGFSYGLETLCGGFNTVAFCETDDYARRVLAKHWPDVPCYGDIKELTVERLASDGITPIDLVCGGFPCQDISVAGKGAGIQGKRSSLWTEMCRLIGEVRPRYALMENVAALLGRGLDVVLGDLAEVGYDAEWHCIPASAVGAPHHRDRAWIIAYPNGERGGYSLERYATLRLFGGGATSRTWPRPPEPAILGVADGVPSRVDRLRCLGNAVVPQVVAVIGKAILADGKEAGGE